MTIKPKLVLVPGLGCTAGMYSHQIQQLSPRVECWVAPLHHIDDLEKMAASILSECSWETFSLAGASMGGYVAFEMARQAPERVISLGAIATMADADGPELAERRKLLDHMVDTGRAGAMWRMSIRRCLARHNRGNKLLADEVFAHVSLTDNDLFKAHQRALAGRRRAPIEKLGCPVIIAAGDCDEVIPYETQAKMTDAIRGARLITLRDCGHLPTWESPDLMTQVLSEVAISAEAVAA